jgi:hypothetical protein
MAPIVTRMQSFAAKSDRINMNCSGNFIKIRPGFRMFCAQGLEFHVSVACCF